MVANPVTDLPEPLSPTNPERFARVERERDPAHRLDEAAAGRERDVQVLDAQQRLGHVRIRGSRMSRIPSPSRLKHSTASHQREAGKCDQPPSAGRDEARALRDHDAPFGRRWLDAEADERKPGGVEDGPAEVERHLHRHRRQHIRQQEAQHHRGMAFAAGARRLDPADIAADIDLGAGKANVKRQVDDGGRDHDILDPVAERGDHRHRQHEQRKGHHHIDETADIAIEPAAGIAAEGADHRADHKGDGDCRRRR